MKNCDVCESHGGRAPQVQRAAERRATEGAIRKTARDILANAAPITDPLSALQQLAGEVMQWKDALKDRVDMNKLRYGSEIGTEQMRSEVALLERALDRCMVILTAIARLNIDDRLTAIEEGKAQMVIRAVQAGLVAAGVTGPAAQAALRAAAAELRIIQGEVVKGAVVAIGPGY